MPFLLYCGRSNAGSSRSICAASLVCKMSVTSFKKEVGKATNFLSFFARTFDSAVCRFQSRTLGFAFSGKSRESFANFGVYIMYNGKAFARTISSEV